METDPDGALLIPDHAGDAWHETGGRVPLDASAILDPLEAQFGEQVRSKDRVRDLAEVFTHQREVDAMLDQIADAFAALDVKFLEPACGSGNFLIEILRRKLRLVSKHDCATQEQYEHRLLRAAASIYGVDISPENVTEARARMAHVLLEHYRQDASTVEPTAGFLNAAALVNLTDSTDLYFGFIGVTGGTIGSFTEDLTGISVSLSTNTGISIEEDDESGYQITFAGTNFSVSLSGDDNDNTYDSDGLGISGLDTDSEVDEVVNSVISELTGETGTFTVTATVFREAAYDNTLGFFAVNSNGDVLNSSGSVATSGSFANNDTYRRAIRDNLLSGGNNIQVANGVASRFDFNVTLNDSSNAGFFILPVLAVQGSFTTAQQIYYPILGINSDTFERMAKQGVDSNGLRVYGFEDLPSGGDRDFDDFIVKIQVTSATVV